MESAVYDPATGLYRAGDLAVSKALTEDLIATAFLRLKAEGQIETVYYEHIPLLSQHLRLMTAPDSILLGAFADRSSKAKGFEFCGMAWVVQREEMGNGMSKAEVGFAFFRHCASPREKVELGKMMAELLFSSFAIDVLIGTTPICNKAALRYSKAIGFTLSGPIKNYVSWEGELSDVCVSTLTKADWVAQNVDRETLSDTPLSIAPSNGYGLLKLCETNRFELVEVGKCSRAIHPKPETASLPE